MEAVLGVSMTPSTVGLVLVEGPEADGATLDNDSFDIRGHSSSLTGEICEQIVAAVRRSEEVAAEHGRRLTTIGVTWSSGAGAEASVLLGELANAGFTDVVPVRLPQATDALARRVAGIVGFDTTGVCVLEPDVVQAMTVAGDSPVQTTVSRGIETVAGLTQWLSEMFETADSRPDALVVVGSAVDLDSVLPKLERALAVPVFTPAEPGLPLARGAALASVRQTLRSFADDGVVSTEKRWHAIHLTPLTILVGGVVAFALSLSLAIGQQLIPGSEPTPHRTNRPVVSTSGDAGGAPHAPAVTIPVQATSTSETPPAAETVEPVAEPEYVVDPSVAVPPEEATVPGEFLDPGLEPIPPELQPQLSEPGTEGGVPEPGEQPVPEDQALPEPPVEAPVAPPPSATEVPPPPPPPATEVAPPPTTETPPPAPEAAPPPPEPAPPMPESPVPESPVPVPAAP